MFFERAQMVIQEVLVIWDWPVSTERRYLREPSVCQGYYNTFCTTQTTVFYRPLGLLNLLYLVFYRPLGLLNLVYLQCFIDHWVY
jgi:hypothetical protein